MNSKGLSLLVVLGFGLLLFAAFLAQNNGTMAAEDGKVQRWEHLAMTVDAAGEEDTSRQIVRLGNEGWELVDLSTLVKDGTTTKLVYCFKRPK